MKKILLVFVCFVLVITSVNFCENPVLAFDENLSVIAVADSCSKSDGKMISCKMSFDKCNVSCNGYAVLYSSIGIIKQITELKVVKGSGDMQFDIECPFISSNDYVRVFFRSSLSSLMPLGNSAAFVQGMAKLCGIITQTSVIGDGNIDKVSFQIIDAFDNPGFDNYVYQYSLLFSYENSINVNKYFGMSCDVHVIPTSNNSWRIEDIKESENNSVERFNSFDIDDSTNSYQINYYPEGSEKIKRLPLSYDVNTYLNYEKQSSTLKDIFNNMQYTGNYNDSEISAIDNNGDGMYDIIMINSYTYYVVTGVNSDKINAENNTKSVTYQFDFEDTDVTNDLFDSDGNRIVFSDIEIGDVIAVFSEADKREEFWWIELVDYGKSSVTGIIEEFSINPVTGLYSISIDGTAYDTLFNSYCNIYVGSSGTFYLTKSGIAFYADIDASKKNNYAYVLDAQLDVSGFSETWQLKLLTKNDGIVVYNVCSTYRVDGYTKNSMDFSYRTEFGNLESGGDISSVKSDANNRLITFELNSDNEIKSIDYIKNNTDYSVWQFTSSTYNSETLRIDAKFFEDYAKVFYMGTDDYSDVCSFDLDKMIDNNSYSGYVISYFDVCECVVITDGECDLSEKNLSPLKDGYILNSSYNDSGNTWKFKLLTQEYEIAEYNVNCSFKLNGISKTDGDDDFDTLFAKFCNSDVNNGYKSGADRIIEYRTIFDDESDVTIKEINFTADGKKITEFSDKTYNASEKTLNGVTLSKGTPIFYVGGENMADSSMYSLDNLSGTDSFSGYMIYKGTPLESVIITSRNQAEGLQDGYILDACINESAFDKVWQIKLLTKDSGIVIYNLASTFTIDGVKGKSSDSSFNSLFIKYKDSFSNSYVSDRIIKYECNANGQIKTVNYVGNSNNYTVKTISGEYKEDIGTAGNNFLSEDVTIYYVGSNIADETFSLSLPELPDGIDINGYIACNGDGDAEIMVVKAFAYRFDFTKDLCVVDSFSYTTTDEGNDALNVKYYTSNSPELKTVVIDEENTYFQYDSALGYDDIDKGTVFMLTDLGEKFSKDVIVFAKANSSTDSTSPAYTINKAAFDSVSQNNNDNEFICGYIKDTHASSKGTVLEYTDENGNDNTVLVKATTNAYCYYNKSSLNKSIVVGEWEYGDVDTYDEYHNEGTYFIARLYEGSARDIITFNTRKTINK